MSETMLHFRSAEINELPPAEDVAPFADWCIEHGEYFTLGGLLLIPDLLVLEFEANGFEMPGTMHIEREDDRTVAVYVVLDGLGYGVRPAQ